MIFLLFPFPASAACLPYDLTTQQLAEKYGEAREAWGIAVSEVGLLELWVNRDTGTVTVLLQTPDGRACPVAAGEYWQPATEKPDGGT